MGPELIIKEQIRKDIVPPPMMCSRFILSLLVNPVKGILGDLLNSPQRFSKQKQRGELPHASLGNVPTQMMGYAPHY